MELSASIAEARWNVCCNCNRKGDLLWKVAQPNGQRPKRLLRTDSQCVKIKINHLICLYWGVDGMPRVAYSEEERERIRVALVRVALDLMTKQGIQHTTVEQIYRRVGISRTFFYSFSRPRRI